MWAGLRKGVCSKTGLFLPDFSQTGPNLDPGMAYGQILGPQLEVKVGPEALCGLGAENRVLKVCTNSPFLFSFIVI